MDRRVKYTRMVLRDSLLNLLSTKSLDQISISELCREADVNRNTFYNHYNAPFEIFHELEDDIFEDLQRQLKNVKDQKKIILIACKVLEKNKKMSKIIYSDIEHSRILSKVISSLSTIGSQNQEKTQTEQEKELVRYLHIFGEKGAVAIIKDWVISGFNQPVESIAEFVAYLLENLDQSFKENYLKRQ